MPILESKLDTRSDEFKQNLEDMLEMLHTIDELLLEASRGGGEEVLERLRS
ncbi:MAG: carboxyl transferase, partial [Pseudomonadales bacterium]|nr:carboxyl transferase [Pseudomonadales bacterium]